jgi:hypothetical protein
MQPRLTLFERQDIIVHGTVVLKLDLSDIPHIELARPRVTSNRDSFQKNS